MAARQNGTTIWEVVKKGGKTGFDKTWKALDKLGAPVNKLSNKLGSEAFWPTTLDKESDKAARILKSFCKDGFYAEEEVQPVDGPKQKQKVIQKIPEKVIRNAKGLAIFTTMRTGLWVSGAGGSGVLVARKPDGSWSPPSGILLHTAGLGFLVGVDIYDCVVVINSEKALEAFTKVRCTLGGEISVVAGPVGAGAVLETEVHKRQAPLYTYLKSRGFYAGVQIDGTIVIERIDENERFYNQKLPVKDILGGLVRHPPYEIKRLMETIKAAQGDTDFDESMIPTEAPPGDYEIEDGHLFGVPEKDDPDPYGVLALEKEGMSLKEAGTQKRASWEQFSFNPNPSSPIYGAYARQSQDLSTRSVSRRNSWRTSTLSTVAPQTPSSLRNSTDQRRSLAVMTDSATQTDLPTQPPLSPSRTSVSGHSRHSSMSNANTGHMQDVPEDDVLNPREMHSEPTVVSNSNGYTTPPYTPPTPGEESKDSPDHEEDPDDVDDSQIIEHPVVHSVQTVQPVTSPLASRARIVNIPKSLPPKLPPRNPGRGVSVVIEPPPNKETSVSVEAEKPVSSLEEAGQIKAANGSHVDASTETVSQKLEDVSLEDEHEPNPEADALPKSGAEVEKTVTEEQQAPNSQEKIPGRFD